MVGPNYTPPCIPEEKWATKEDDASPGEPIDIAWWTVFDDPLQGGKPIARVVTWLASEASRDFNGEIVHVMRGLLGIMQQPAVIRAFTNDELRTVDEIDSLMPALLEARKANVAAAEKDGTPTEG